jgi:hypothetical protein
MSPHLKDSLDTRNPFACRDGRDHAAMIRPNHSMLIGGSGGPVSIILVCSGP